MSKNNVHNFASAAVTEFVKNDLPHDKLQGWFLHNVPEGGWIKTFKTICIMYIIIIRERN